jgi:hypothetical protein
VMYYWHFVISYHDKQKFSVCYHTVSPLGDIGKYFTIVKRKVIFPISQILTTLVLTTFVIAAFALAKLHLCSTKLSAKSFGS